MFSLKKLAPKAPNVLIAVVVTTVLSATMGFADKGGNVVGEVPAGITMPMLPSGIEWDVLVQLITTAVIIGVIGFMEAISIAKAMATQTRQRLDPNQELIGQGLSNLVSGAFQGYAVSGSFARAAWNISAGAVTGFSCLCGYLCSMLIKLF